MREYAFATLYVKSEDPEDTAAWFVHILGARLKSSTQIGSAQAISVELGGLPITISAPWDDETALPACIQPRYGLDSLALYVANLDDDIEALTAKGCVFLGEPEVMANGRTTFIEGPERMRIQLIEITPEAQAQ